MTSQDCILELPEMTYDKNKLVEIFNQTKKYARVKSLPWRPPYISDVDKAYNVVIQSHDYMMLNEQDKGQGFNLLEFDYIRNILNRLDLHVDHTNLDIMWNRPDFRFSPHIDGWAASVIVWPILSDGDFNPVDFYDYDGKTTLSSEYKQLTDADIAYTHHYSDTCATVFNSHLIHGVRLVKNNRIFLRLRTNVEFETIKEKYNNGTLIKK